MSDAHENVREKALMRYKILTPCQGILGLGLLACGVIGAVLTPSRDKFSGPPYFLGGFIVGCLQLLASVCAGCVVMKGEVKRTNPELGCIIMGHYIIAMLTFMGCFIGLIFAGVFGLSNANDREDGETETQKHLSYGIIAGCLLALCATIFSMYLVCTFGQALGGVTIRSGRRARVLVQINQQAIPTGQNPAQVEQLRTQNLLLQQQLTLQQQMLHQQQQQQQQQQFSGGMFPPPPPPDYNTATSNPGFGINPAMPSAQSTNESSLYSKPSAFGT